MHSALNVGQARNIWRSMALQKLWCKGFFIKKVGEEVEKVSDNPFLPASFHFAESPCISDIYLFDPVKWMHD